MRLQHRIALVALGLGLIAPMPLSAQRVTGQTTRDRSRARVRAPIRSPDSCPCRTRSVDPTRHTAVQSPAVLAWTEPWRQGLHHWLGRLIGNPQAVEKSQSLVGNGRFADSRLTRLRVREAALEQGRLEIDAGLPPHRLTGRLAGQRGSTRNRLEQRPNREPVLRWVSGPTVRSAAGVSLERR